MLPDSPATGPPAHHRPASLRRQVVALFVRDPLLWLALVACPGIYLADTLPAVVTPLMAVAVVSVLVPLSWWRPHTLLVLATCFSTYAFLHAVHRQQIFDFPELESVSSNHRPAAQVEGIILRAPRIPEKDEQNPVGSLTLQLTHLTIANRAHNTKHNIRVRLNPLPKDLALCYGDRIAVSGILHRLEPARNPGAFDPERFFLRSADALVELRSGTADHFALLETQQGNPIRHFAESSREWLAAAICRDLEDSPQSIAILQAMALGAREQTPEDLEELFRFSGSLHIFAVSGMHVGIFAAIAWGLLSLLRLPRRWLVALVIPAVLFYAVVTGLRPSACRAAIMATVILLGLASERRPRLLNSLGLAALILLAINTQQLFSPGFQLSFAVLIAIAVLGNPLRIRLQKVFAIDPLVPVELVPRWRKKLAGGWNACTALFAVSLAAWIGSAPLVIYHFHLLTPIAILSNLLMVPLAALILGVSCFSILSTAAFLKPLALLANNANWMLTKLLVVLASAFSAIPGGHLSFAPGTDFAAESPTQNSSQPEAPPLSPPLCRLLVLDTGDSGAAQLITTPPVDASRWSAPAQAWLIDPSSENTFPRIVEPALRSRAVTRLNGLVLTHGDTRHIGGTPLAIQRFQPTGFFQSHLPNRSPTRQAIGSAAEQHSLPTTLVDSGDAAMSIDSKVKMTILFPPPDQAALSPADNQSMVLRLNAGPWRILMMSDAGYPTERWMLDNIPAAGLRCDVIVKGRHRTEPSAGSDFLRIVEPQAIISTNTNFPNGERIPEEWRRELMQRGIDLFDQSETGAVEVILRESEIEILSTASDQILRSRSR